jgi:hypothetical protein
LLGFGKLRRLRGTAEANSAAGPLGLSTASAREDGAAPGTNGASHSRTDGAPRNGFAHGAYPASRAGVLEGMAPISEFIAVLPRLDRAPLRPPTFTNFKIPDAQGYLRLKAEIAPIKLFGENPLAVHAEAATLVETLPEPALPEPVQTPMEIPQRDPLWFSLAASKSADAAVADHDFARAAFEEMGPQLEPLEFTDDVADAALDESVVPDLNIEDDSIFDSPLPFREYGPQRRSRPWQAIEAFFLSRGFSQAVALCVLALFVSTLDVPWKNWFDHQIQRVKDPIVSIASNLSRPIKERSAFFIVDDFSSGVGNWINNRSLSVTDAGYVAVKPGLSLHGGTMNLESYRLDFEAKIQSEAVGWVVRAADTNNYYAFKLVEKGRKAHSFDLLRYTVVKGAKDAVQGIASIAVPENLTASADFNRISVRVRDNQITTLINGWGVDFWQDNRFARGGVGLLADRGEASLIRKMSIAGNEDTWGLILYGTLETIRSVQNTFSAPVALRMQPGPAGLNTAMLLTPSSQPFLLSGSR